MVGKKYFFYENRTITEKLRMHVEIGLIFLVGTDTRPDAKQLRDIGNADSNWQH